VTVIESANPATQLVTGVTTQQMIMEGILNTNCTNLGITTNRTMNSVV